MTRIEINVYSTHYAPIEDGADERQKLSTYCELVRFDSARECADWLIGGGLQSPSDYPRAGARTWLSDVDAYEHPHTGVLTEQSAHPRGVNPRLWAAIVETVRFPGH